MARKLMAKANSNGIPFLYVVGMVLFKGNC